MSDDVHAKLDELLAQARATNGRVNMLEDQMSDVRDVLYGDKERATVGLIRQSKEVDVMLRQWGNLTKAMKWVAVTFGTATVGLIGNILGAGFGG